MTLRDPPAQQRQTEAGHAHTAMIAQGISRDSADLTARFLFIAPPEPLWRHDPEDPPDTQPTARGPRDRNAYGTAGAPGSVDPDTDAAFNKHWCRLATRRRVQEGVWISASDVAAAVWTPEERGWAYDRHTSHARAVSAWQVRQKHAATRATQRTAPPKPVRGMALAPKRPRSSVDDELDRLLSRPSKRMKVSA